MIFKRESYEVFKKIIKDKKIIQFGASSAWNYYFNIFPDAFEQIVKRTCFIVDNDIRKQGKEFEIAEHYLQVKNPKEIFKERNCVILITVSMAYQENICEQLSNMNLPDDVQCFSLPLMIENEADTNNECVERYFKKHTKRLNVPRIHTFWFSGEEKPELYTKCLQSWHKFCPEFEIIEWNTQNYDVNKNAYMREAFEYKKWAFISDYARLDVIYQYGGIYMDMDVELVASLAPLLNAESFFCRQEDGLVELGSGFGAPKGDLLIKEMIDTYAERKLIMDDGKIDMTSQPEWLNNVLVKNGIGKGHDSQIVNNRLVLSNDYITCYSGNSSLDKAKLGIHWHNGGWLDEKDRKLLRDSNMAKERVKEKYFKIG